jgi:EAL domain-containing protein (putative c-di-GMP-specific phosphodiesterase class I)
MALGHWVLHEACRQAKCWLDAGIAPELVAVNVSALQFKAPADFEKDVHAILDETGLPPGMLELEITETALLDSTQEHTELLQRLRHAGIRIAIDDFGTGYSSLLYLRRFPVDRIKVAQEFVHDLFGDAGNVAITKATIALAHELSLKVIAEGVETADQLTTLQSWGCREVQGFYFAPPVSADEATALLRQGAVRFFYRPSAARSSEVAMPRPRISGSRR